MGACDVLNIHFACVTARLSLGCARWIYSCAIKWATVVEAKASKPRAAGDAARFALEEERSRQGTCYEETLSKSRLAEFTGTRSRAAEPHQRMTSSNQEREGISVNANVGAVKLMEFWCQSQHSSQLARSLSILPNPA